MTKGTKWQIGLGAFFLALSAIFYIIHYFIFKDAHHIFIYLLGDIAFVFVEVLLVTVVIHELLSFREKAALLGKLNMVIGLFYSEMGRMLLKIFSDFDSSSQAISKELIIKKDWEARNFIDLKRCLSVYSCSMAVTPKDISHIKEFLLSKKEFLARLLENPNLLEHETFTNLLWAIFHLLEELEYRSDFKDMPSADIEHISGDIKRVYGLLMMEWIDYMNHLKNNYSYLFSLALRTNPFDAGASVIIK